MIDTGRRFILSVFIFSSGIGVFYALLEVPRTIGMISPVPFSGFKEIPREGSGILGFFTSVPEKGKNIGSLLGNVLGENVTRKLPFREIFGFENTRVGPILTIIPTPTPTPTITPTPIPTMSPSSNSQPTPSPSSSSPTPTSIYPTATPTLPVSTVTPLTVDQKDVLASSQTIVNLLIGKKYGDLYNSMSGDFKSTFSYDDFVSSFASATDVVSGTASTSVKIYGQNSEWAETTLTLILTDGTSKSYQLTLHKEGDSWVLYGTEDQV